MGIFNYFDQVKIVNLQSRKDRREETIKEFKEYGFPIQTEKVDFVEAVSPSSPGGFPSKGVRGCFLSHLNILEDAERLGVKNILILEDDISFSKYIVEYGRKAVQSLSGLDWDIVYFGHTVDEDLTVLRWMPADQPVMLSHFYAVNGKVLADFVRFLHGVLERSPGHLDGGPMHYDAAINTFRKFNPNVKAYCFSRNLGYQRASRSDLNDSLAEEGFFLKPVFRCVRKLKRGYMKRTR